MSIKVIFIILIFSETCINELTINDCIQYNGIFTINNTCSINGSCIINNTCQNNIDENICNSMNGTFFNETCSNIGKCCASSSCLTPITYSNCIELGKF